MDSVLKAVVECVPMCFHIHVSLFIVNDLCVKHGSYAVVVWIQVNVKSSFVFGVQNFHNACFIIIYKT
jgi:hypothetical protein